MQEQRNILVLEDRENWQDMLKTVLESEGHRVVVTSTLEEARVALQEQAFHLAIVDMRLVDADLSNIEGMQLLPDIKRYGDGTSVIVLTGYGTVKLARDALKLHGVLDFVEKQSMNSEGFKKLVKEGIEDARREWTRSSTIRFALESYLRGTSLEAMARAVIPEIEYVGVREELEGFLRRLLLDFLPLAPQACKVSFLNGAIPTIEILCWSRGRREALAIRFGRKDATLSPIESERYGHMEEREAHSTSHFAGSTYALVDMSFRELASLVEDKVG